MARCWLRGAAGDALHVVLCAAGFNLRWLQRAIACGAIRVIFLHLLAWPKGVGLGASAPWRGWIEALGGMIVLRGRSSGLGQAQTLWITAPLGVQAKRKRAGWDVGYLARVLGIRI